jgi:hypothetical protein
MTVFASYKGNARKQAEAAGKAFCQAILYVKDGLRSGDSLHFVDRLKDGSAARRELRVLGALPEYPGLSGTIDRSEV